MRNPSFPDIPRLSHQPVLAEHWLSEVSNPAALEGSLRVLLNEAGYKDAMPSFNPSVVL